MRPRAAQAATLAALATLAVGCGPATQPTAPQPTAAPTTAPATTDRTTPLPDSITTQQWRGTHFRYQQTPGASTPQTVLVLDVTNEASTMRNSSFSFGLTRLASGAEVTNTQAKATNVGPGITVTISGPASRPLSDGLDMSAFTWTLQPFQ